METKFESFYDDYLKRQETMRKRKETISKKYNKFKPGDIVIYDHPIDGSSYPETYEITSTKLDNKYHQFVMAKNVNTGKYKNTIFKEDMSNYDIEQKFRWIDSDFFKTELEYSSKVYNL